MQVDKPLFGFHISHPNVGASVHLTRQCIMTIGAHADCRAIKISQMTGLLEIY